MPAIRVYPANHITQLRVEPAVWAWVMAKSSDANMPPSTYINRRIKELAIADLRKGGSDGDLRDTAQS